MSWRCMGYDSQLPHYEEQSRSVVRIQHHHSSQDDDCYAAVTCEIKLFYNYFSFHRRPSEIILPEIISEAYCSL